MTLTGADRDTVIERALDERDEALSVLDSGHPEAAQALAQAALDRLEALGGELDAEIASVVMVLGDVRANLGDHEGARRLAARAARLLLSPPGDDPDRLRLWCQIHTRVGDRERHAGDLDAAETRLREVIAAARAGLGEIDDAVGAALNVLGIVYKYAARFDDAEVAYRQALTIAEADPDPMVLATLFHNLAGLDHARGCPSPGIVWGERGLRLREATLGAGHPDVAADHNNLGALYHLAGRLTDAAASYRQALAVFEACYGPDHYEVAMTCANLAALASDEGRDGEAVTLGERALRILEHGLGPHHPEVGLTLHNLGVAHLNAGRPDRAAEALTRAVAVLAAGLPPDHAQLDAARAVLAQCEERAAP